MSTRVIAPIYVGLVLVISCTFLPAQQPRQATPLTVDEVVKLHQAGFTDELLITRIKKNAKPFDLTAEELVELKKLGLSESVIKYLVDPSMPYIPTAPPTADPNRPNPPPAPVPAPVPENKRAYPADPYASRVPGEPGVYCITADQPARIEIKVLLGVNEGAGLGKVLMKKAKMMGYLPGPVSRTRIPSAPTPPTLYVRLAPGKAVEEIVLLALDTRQDRREIEMGPPGPKPEFKAEAIRQFDRVEVGPQLFRITPARLTKGEYLFFLLGSAEPPKGSYGKGYDFGIDLPLPAGKQVTK